VSRLTSASCIRTRFFAGRCRPRTACWRRRSRSAAHGQCVLHDAEQEGAPGGAAEGRQVCGMRRLAGQAHRLVQHHGVVQVLRQAGQGSPDGTCMGCWNRGAPRHAPSSSRSISCCHHRWRRVLRPPALMPARQAALDGCSARPALLKGRCNTATGPQSGAWRPRPTLWTRPRGTTSRLPARGAASCGAVCTGRLAKCVRVRAHLSQCKHTIAHHVRGKGPPGLVRSARRQHCPRRGQACS